ncbi:hypothetical protein HWHPT5561_06355 [Petrotoga sp. HWH.PT.55.6.1]|uniref:hypothetical protein n=1 Tax=unclassified Petrotoga TaxID=2620614 RepID=UPI000CA05CFB|nr:MULTISPECIES: hypothetical protein [unclassified Petrotoga]PNR92120.1 hypothetical protein X926_07275 [Petrotoga sp. HWHPT.55.6.3]RPD35667.1 hypothetical protein HWHPT5561_06355 [Petrotoga sp. HWH.PT.55.6.1]
MPRQKKSLFFIFLLLPSFFFGFFIDYDSATNANIVFFETQSKFEIYPNDSKTIYKISFEEKIFEQVNYKISKGPIKEVSTSKNVITIKFLYPINNLEIKDDRIIFYGYEPYNFQQINFEKIKLDDAIDLLFTYIGWNWIKTEELPDTFFAINSNEIHIEHFLRMLNEVYSLNTIFYDEDTVLVGKQASVFENDLPLFIENENISEESSSTNFMQVSSKEDSLDKNQEYLLFFESKYDLTRLEKIFDCKVAFFEDSYYAVLAKEGEKDQINELINYLNEIPETYDESLLIASQEISETPTPIEKKENYDDESYIVLTSTYDMTFLEEILPLKTYKLDKQHVLLIGSSESIKIAEKINELVQPQIIPKKTQPVINQELVTISVKKSTIFEKLLIQEDIHFSKITAQEDYVLYMLEYEESLTNFVKNILDSFPYEKGDIEVSLKELISLVAKAQSINVISDFENDKKITINNFNLDMSSLQPYLVSQDIWYENIGHNTLRFYEQKKLLKYEIFVFSGQNVDRFSVEELYLLTLQFDGIINGSKDRASLISKPVIYVNEGEPASIKSVLSVPVFDEEGKIVSKIESGFIMEVSGEYDNITKLVNTELDISISELKNEDKNIVDERNMSSKFTIPNGGFIKLGGLNFTSIVENESGIPIFKEIPVIGQLFTSYEKTENVYDLVILIHVEVSNKPKIENHF